MVLMNTIKLKLLRVTDQYVHETIRIMKLLFMERKKLTNYFVTRTFLLSVVNST